MCHPRRLPPRRCGSRPRHVPNETRWNRRSSRQRSPCVPVALTVSGDCCDLWGRLTETRARRAPLRAPIGAFWGTRWRPFRCAPPGSPRPLRLITRARSGSSRTSEGSLRSAAIACADSSAQRMPSVRASTREQTLRSLEAPLEPPGHPLAAAGCLDRVELARDPPHRRLENLVGRRRAASRRRRAVVEARQDARVVDHRPPRDRTRSDAVRELPGKAAEETVRVRDGAGDRGRVGAIRDIELDCDESVSQGHARVPRDRRGEQREQLGLRIGLAAERKRADRPQLGMVLPESQALRALPCRRRRRRRDRDVGGRGRRPRAQRRRRRGRGRRWVSRSGRR